METLTTILVTTISVAAIFCLGACIRAIVNLRRRVSYLETLPSDMNNIRDSFHRSIDTIYRDLGGDIDSVKNEIYRRIDSVILDNEKQMDKRFDKIYHKLKIIVNEK